MLKSQIDIRRIRNSMGLSRRELAAEMGVSPRTIEAWENGFRVPSPQTMKMLSMIQEKFRHD
jgi:DNA-binding transcriptional regulator YiaG